jgi:general secretion pathway protein A
MYERFYQLRERPFSLSPDPDYLYPSRVHREALSYLRYGIEGHAGFVVITGEIGSGKTTLLQTLLRGLDRETTLARIVNTMLDPRELLEAILLDLGLEPEAGKPAMLRQLAEFLVRERQDGRLVLLVIDEAQNLGLAALEELRMLSNLETEKSKLLQMVLVGQPDLRDTLARPELEQLRQRVTVSYHLGPLDAEETAAYINHRLRRAAAGPPLEFPPEVTELVHRRSRGVPRIINVIADAILLFGYGAERLEIDRDLAEEVMVELEATGVLPRDEDAPDAAGREPVAAPAPALVREAPAASRTNTADTRPAPASRADAVDAALQAREAAIARREAEVAEQRRVLAEQYRLLRGDGNEPSRARAGGQAWPPVAYPQRPAVDTAPAADARGHVHPFDAPRPTWWNRVRRAFGAPSPVVGERSS